MDRSYMNATIEQLETLVRENLSNRVVLAQVPEELQFHSRPRARQLLREVIGLLDGQLPTPPKPPKEDNPENQLPLIR